MAAKSHLRNGRPVLLAVSTNDALAGAAENIGRLLARKNFYFVPFGQDDPEKKPTSMVADFSRLLPALEAALEGRQLQPMLYSRH
jgi:dipicolinate synthase subunit B